MEEFKSSWSPACLVGTLYPVGGGWWIENLEPSTTTVRLSRDWSITQVYRCKSKEKGQAVPKRRRYDQHHCYQAHPSYHLPIPIACHALYPFRYWLWRQLQNSLLRMMPPQSLWWRDRSTWLHALPWGSFQQPWCKSTLILGIKIGPFVKDAMSTVNAICQAQFSQVCIAFPQYPILPIQYFSLPGISRWGKMPFSLHLIFYSKRGPISLRMIFS